MASWNRTLERNGLMPFTMTYDFRKLPGRTFPQPDISPTDTSLSDICQARHIVNGHSLDQIHFSNTLL